MYDVLACRYHAELCGRGMNANEACALALRAAAGQGTILFRMLPVLVPLENHGIVLLCRLPQLLVSATVF